MYKLLYIDEEESHRNAFQRAFHEDTDIGVDVLNPYETIDECVEHIFSNNYNAVVTDYKLNEHLAINYTGTDLVENVLNVREGFPIVVLTGYPNGPGNVAIDYVADANIVYDKRDLEEDSKLSLLRDVILTNVKNYEKKISTASERISELVEKDSLTPREESELLQLDGFLERAISKQDSIPDSVKSQFLEKKFDDIISLGKEILERNNT